MKKYIYLTCCVGVFFSGCTSRQTAPSTIYHEPSSKPIGISHQPPSNNAKLATMRPYTIRGITCYPTVVSVGNRSSGIASWYGPDFHGKKTSNGEIYDMHTMTAAHKTLPMNTIVRVTNKKNGKSEIVRINDRGPFVAGRIIDLSNLAARKLDIVAQGTAPVELEVLGFASVGSKTIPSTAELKKSTQSVAIGDFAVQIASFARFEGATITQKKYDGIDGYSAIIKDAQTQKGRLFRIYLKGFKSEAEARDYISKSSFSGAFIVRED
ncbi:MAG: septal ring lytic transglycosylase RlpA family protein [Sulfurimonadaceae bacterium]|nr:septal ring lytic transglycosylase RlpA family protein [Sulfurimonadaceae bacterium]